MFIGVGIHENIVISKAFINEKERLVIELAKAEAAGKEAPSVFDTLLTAGVQNESTSDTQLQLFGPLLPKKEDQTEEQKRALVVGDITRLRNQLTQILEQYMLQEKIDLNEMDVQFAGTGITDGKTFEARILDQDVLNRVYDNLVKRFVELIQPFVNNPEYAVRFKLIRQSKDKHFATIPSRYLSEQPFIELMSVPKEQSRVQFSKWETDNGYDNGTPIKAEEKAEKKEKETEMANPFAAH